MQEFSLGVRVLHRLRVYMCVCVCVLQLLYPQCVTWAKAAQCIGKSRRVCCDGPVQIPRSTLNSLNQKGLNPQPLYKYQEADKMIK